MLLQGRSIFDLLTGRQELNESARVEVAKATQAELSGDWSLLAWVRGVDVSSVITAALQQSVASKGLGDDPAAVLGFLRALEDWSAIEHMIRTNAVIAGISELL
jgi:hypothetical protein